MAAFSGCGSDPSQPASGASYTRSLDPHPPRPPSHRQQRAVVGLEVLLLGKVHMAASAGGAGGGERQEQAQGDALHTASPLQATAQRERIGLNGGLQRRQRLCADRL